MSNTRVLEVIPGHLNSSNNDTSGEFRIDENGSGFIFDATIDFALPPFTSARPNAKLYYESNGTQPNPKQLQNPFKLYIDSQGIRIVFEDGILITAVFDKEIVLDAKGYEIQGSGIWIGIEVGHT